MKHLLFTLLISPLVIDAYSQETDLISDFKQTVVTVSPQFQKCSDDKKLGNCVAIAVIKCALGQFKSIENVYDKFELVNGVYKLTFVDGLNVEVLQEEVDIVKQLSGIKPVGDSKFYEDALVIYASMCKRILLNCTDYTTDKECRCVISFTNAVEMLNSGFTTDEGNTLLGMQKEYIDIDGVTSESNAVIWCSAHAAYSSGGHQDLLGDRIPIVNGKMRNLARYSKIKGAYKLIK